MLYGYTDANLGGNMYDRRYTSDYVFMCSSVGVSWCSKKQDLLSLSTIEAGYKEASLVFQECISLSDWSRMFIFLFTNPL